MRTAKHSILFTLGLLAAVTAASQQDGEWRCVNPTAGQAAVCSWLWDVGTDGSGFVAVGERGKLMASTDGFSWEDRVSGTDEHLNGVIHNGSLWVVVGGGGTILTSLDGVVWTSRSSGSSIRLADVTWDDTLGLFVAVGGEFLSSTRILTSPDGVTWTPRTSKSYTDIRGVVCDGLRCVAVGASGTIQTSPDAVTWTLTPPQASAANLNGVTTNGSLFVIAAQGDSYGGPYILTSPDGTTWTQVENGAKNLKDIIWSGSQFVAVGTLGVSYTSPDGTTWTPRYPGGNRELFGVAFDGTTYVAVGSVALKTSANGQSWTDRLAGNIPNLNMGITNVVWTGWQFIAVGHSGALVTSPDGLNWVEHSSVSSRDLFGLALGAGSQFNYAAAAESGRIYTADDLDAWTERTTETTNDLMAIASNGFRFVAVGVGGVIQTSALGDVWTATTSPTTQKLNSVIWNGSQFVAVGHGGTVLTSPDGTVWSEQVFGSSLELHEVIWDGSQLIVSAQSGHVGLSTDGTAWTINSVDAVSGWPLYGIHANPSYLVAAGALGTVVGSDDASAVPWSQHDSRVWVDFADVGGDSKRFIAVGEAGAILTWSPPILVDGFESGDTSAWSSAVP